MASVFEIGVINAAVATVLALCVCVASRCWRQPVFVHALWLIVLLKLVTPPLVGIPWRFAGQPTARTTVGEAESNVASSLVDTFVTAPPANDLMETIRQDAVAIPASEAAPHGLPSHPGDLPAEAQPIALRPWSLPWA